MKVIKELSPHRLHHTQPDLPQPCALPSLQHFSGQVPLDAQSTQTRAGLSSSHAHSSLMCMTCTPGRSRTDPKAISFEQPTRKSAFTPCLAHRKPDQTSSPIAGRAATCLLLRRSPEEQQQEPVKAAPRPSHAEFLLPLFLETAGAEGQVPQEPTCSIPAAQLLAEPHSQLCRIHSSTDSAGTEHHTRPCSPDIPSAP